MKKICLVLVCLMSVDCIGCTSVSIQRVQTGLFQNDPEKLMTAYEQIRIGTTVEKAKEIGWNFNAPNIKQIAAPGCLKFLLGENIFQGIGSGAITLLEKLSEFYCFLIPAKSSQEVTKYTGFNKREKITDGHDLFFLFLIEKDTIVYKQSSKENINYSILEKSLGKNLLQLIETSKEASPPEIKNPFE